MKTYAYESFPYVNITLISQCETKTTPKSHENRRRLYVVQEANDLNFQCMVFRMQ